MGLLIYVPLERLVNRYTVHLDDDITHYLQSNGIEHIKVESTDTQTMQAPSGMFLHPALTINTKANQISQIAKLYAAGHVTNDTTFFFSDLWFPGIESLLYLNYFYKVKPKVTGIIHAGSFTDTDYTRDMERWAKSFEEIVFDMCDEIYVGSNFIKRQMTERRWVSNTKISVTGLPLDSKLDNIVIKKDYPPIVVFNGRDCDEKQPHLWRELNRKLSESYGSDIQCIWTQKISFDRASYYNVLSRATVVVSFALQENFGYGVLEAVKLGCMPVVPDRLAYKEFFDKAFRYTTSDECFDKVKLFIEYYDKATGPVELPLSSNEDIFKAWFK
jgi:hypothetical protein